MKIKPIIIVAGEPKSIFYEIFFKSLKDNKFKSPLLLITSLKLFKSQMTKFKFRGNINLIDIENLNKLNSNKNINIINVDYNNSKQVKNIYLNKCFDIAFKLIRKKITNKFINGPINKSSFLNKKYLGITEYISKKFNVKKCYANLQ